MMPLRSGECGGRKEWADYDDEEEDEDENEEEDQEGQHALPVPLENCPGGLDQGRRLLRRADRDPQVIAHVEGIEPAHEKLAVTQFLEPILRREPRGLDQKEIRLAG